MRDLVTTIAEVLGGVLVAVGVGAFDWRVGIATLGAELIVFGYRAAGDDEPSPNP